MFQYSGGLSVIPCPLCGMPEDPAWMNFHLIAGHGFAGGLPSPASTSPGGASPVVSSGFRDGGGGRSDTASVSTGRGPEKGPQRSPGAQGGKIEATAKPEGLEAFTPDRDAQDRAEAWFQTRFFKKGGIGDNDWKPLVGACKTWGMPDDAKWRDWLKTQWETSRAVAVKVLITAKAIEGPPAGQPLNAVAKAVLAALEADHDTNTGGLTLADLVAKAAPGATQTHIDDLVDAGLVYEPLPGRWRRNKQGVK